MSTSEWLLRAKGRFDPRRLLELPSPGRWIGVDLAGQDGAQQARKFLPLLGLALIAALGVSALRIDLIRIRYAMASVVERETDLLEEQRALIVRRRQLRDPIELAVQARARGFRPPRQIVVLHEPTSSSLIPSRIDLEDGIEAPPSVTAGPPDDRSRRNWR
jgi:hypothetical protein